MGVLSRESNPIFDKCMQMTVERKLLKWVHQTKEPMGTCKYVLIHVRSQKTEK